LREFWRALAMVGNAQTQAELVAQKAADTQPARVSSPVQGRVHPPRLVTPREDRLQPPAAPWKRRLQVGQATALTPCPSKTSAHRHASAVGDLRPLVDQVPEAM
ncbi:MAG: hypothetical protein LC799_36145, partial [Actinobacteria bacterium]|nr:hypothetical protein [Actinomycetota bacterium]